MIGYNFSPAANSVQKELTLRDGLRGGRFVPLYSNITGVAAASGIYQVCFGICHVFIRFDSDGSLAIPVNAAIELPIKPYSYTKGAATEFSADNFWFDARSGPVVNIRGSMSDVTGLVNPQTAIAATAVDYVFSGWYLIN